MIVAARQSRLSIPRRSIIVFGKSVPEAPLSTSAHEVNFDPSTALSSTPITGLGALSPNAL
jgi:hypothetical protein